MKIRTLWAVLLLTPCAAYAETGEEKRCLLISAAQLPRVEGLQIAEGRISSGNKPSPNVRYVDIDVKAIGRTTTFSYMCAWSGSSASSDLIGVR